MRMGTLQGAKCRGGPGVEVWSQRGSQGQREDEAFEAGSILLRELVDTCIKVDDRDWAMYLVESTERGQCDGVITTKSQ